MKERARGGKIKHIIIDIICYINEKKRRKKSKYKL